MDFARRKLHRSGVELSYPALGGGYRHLLLDQRGQGHSTRFPSDVGRAAFTADAAELIRTATGQEPVLPVGQPMGGHAAAWSVALRPWTRTSWPAGEDAVRVGTSPGSAQ